MAKAPQQSNQTATQLLPANGSHGFVHNTQHILYPQFKRTTHQYNGHHLNTNLKNLIDIEDLKHKFYKLIS